MDAFISIHCNSAENKDASGIETFKYPGVGGVTKRLAENIQNGLASNFPEEKDRGVKEAKYYVLKHTNAPAALVEVGFISHDPTAEKLFRFSYQDKLARVIAEGVEKRKLFKSTLNNRLHRNLACVIDKSSRGAKLERAFEELPKLFLEPNFKNSCDL